MGAHKVRAARNHRAYTARFGHTRASAARSRSAIKPGGTFVHKLISLVATAAALLLSFNIQSAAAQASRTWVSGVGDDANPCSRTAPCKTFAGAISKTAASGEISVLDPGGFGAVTITKSITISGDGTLAGILNALTNGVIINAATTDVVQLRNISIAGFGTGTNGIRVLQAGMVVIDRVTIADQSGSGIDITTAQSAPMNVIVRNSVISNVLDAAATAGIKMSSSASTVNVVIDGVSIQGVDYVGATPPATLPAGVLVGTGATAHLDRVTISRAGIGVAATTATSTAYLSDSTISQNATGLSATNSARIISYNNNRLRGNTTDGAPTSTVYTR